MHIYVTNSPQTDFAKRGIKVSGVELDLDTMMKTKRDTVAALTGG